jgi:hypothetical protein
MIINNKPLSAAIRSAGRSMPGATAEASGPIGISSILNIVGSQDDFLTRYEDFQKRYIRALETSLDPSKVRRS